MSEAGAISGVRAPAESRAVVRPGRLRYFLRRNPRVLMGGSVVLFLALVAILAPYIVPYDPVDVDPSQGSRDIPTLLRRLDELGIAFKDLSTHQSSLEEIFVSLVSHGADAQTGARR